MVVFAGKEYGTGSSRDWAAKGTKPARHPRRDRPVLRAHPPLEPGRHGHRAAGLRGRHVLAVARPEGRRDRHHQGHRRRPEAAPDARRGDHFADGSKKVVPLLCRIDTLDELDYFQNGGILQYVLRNLVA
ncbi:MAG: hypothetical protein P0Y66_02355 [Candidatus Kaistia colombiensis]|nr:MAG: hypothetical protein P0Y66_02355 [Kaistia sp.]